MAKARAWDGVSGAARTLGAAVARGLGGGKALSTAATSRGGWLPIVRESYAGAWQRGVAVDANSVMVYPSVFGCMTLIAGDIAKMRIKLVRQAESGIWQEVESPTFSPVLRKPNPNQTRIQFLENWILSKLSRGNAVILKGRDGAGRVNRLWVLDWNLVKPLISEDGEVFYELAADNVAGIRAKVVVPSSEIIHDRFNCLFHPLIGLSPIAACGVTATVGLNIQANASKFFAGGSMPPGILVAPGSIDPDAAARLKAQWEANYGGPDNATKVAVLGDGLKFERMSMSAVDSQLIDQLRWTAEVVCSVFHVPPYKLGIGDLPGFENVQALNVEYYTQALQILIESIELCLDEGLGLNANDNKGLGTELDIDALLRMDGAALMKMLGEAVKGSIMAPDEARAKIDLGPVPGGASPMAQQQNYSLGALAKRDAREDPFAKAAGGPEPSATNDNARSANIEAAKMLTALAIRFRGGR